MVIRMDSETLPLKKRRGRDYYLPNLKEGASSLPDPPVPVSLINQAVLAFEELMTRAFIGKPEDVKRDRIIREVTQRIAIENHAILLQLQRIAGEYRAQDFWTDGFNVRWGDDFAGKIAHDPAAQQLLQDYVFRIGIIDGVRGLPIQKPGIDSYCRGYRQGQAD